EVLRIRKDVPLREHDPLGPARGPAGVTEIEHLVLAPVAGRVVEGRACPDECLVIEELFVNNTAVDEDDVLNPRRALPKLTIELDVFAAEEQRFDLTVVADEPEFRRRKPDVERRKRR